jgi:hypothetical protein
LWVNIDRGGSFLDVLRCVFHREIHRSCDEAVLMDLPVERLGARKVSAAPYPDCRAQRRAKKSPSAVRARFTHTDRLILVSCDDDARDADIPAGG